MKHSCMLCERDFLDATSCFNHVLECGGVVKNHKTLRDEFAMAALTGLLLDMVNTSKTMTFDETAEYSYKLADAMLEAREQKK